MEDQLTESGISGASLGEKEPEELNEDALKHWLVCLLLHPNRVLNPKSLPLLNIRFHKGKGSTSKESQSKKSKVHAYCVIIILSLLCTYTAAICQSKAILIYSKRYSIQTHAEEAKTSIEEQCI